MPPHHANKLSGVLHATVRDWAAEGSGERLESFGQLLQTLKKHRPVGSRVLLPGSGLARLLCETCAAGYKVCVLAAVLSLSHFAALVDSLMIQHLLGVLWSRRTARPFTWPLPVSSGPGQ